MNGNGHAHRPGLINRAVRDGPGELESPNLRCACCGIDVGRLSRFKFSRQAALCLHLQQPINRNCREYYRQHQAAIVGPRNILVQTLHCDGHKVFALDVDGRRRMLCKMATRQDAIRWVFGQVTPIYRAILASG